VKVAGPPPPYGPRPPGFGRSLALLVLRLGVLAVVVYALVRFVPWSRVPGTASPMDSAQASGWAASTWDSLKGATRDLGNGSVKEFFSPVLERYGAETTAILAGVLLLALGYWLFIRTK
jgi:hypothetical protein